MLKKTIPFVFLSALLLGACTNGGNNGNNDAVPNNNETPMENMEDRERNWTPEMEDERQGGPGLDGVETDNRNDGGILNDENGDMNNDRNDPLLDDDNAQDKNNNNNGNNR